MSAPAAAACRSSSRSSLRPRPSPRTSGDTHIRFSSTGRPGRILSAPQPTGRSTEVCHQQQPGGRLQLVDRRGDADGRIEAVLEALAQLGEVLLDAPARVGAGRIGDGDRDQRGSHQPLDLVHRRHQPRALRLLERLQHRRRQPVREAIELRAFRPPVRRQPGAAHAAVGAAGSTTTSRSRLQRAQQPARVAGVEAQPPAQVAHVGAVGADLPQQARLAQRPAAVEVALVQGAHPLRDGAVEAAHARDRLDVHCLTLVKESRAVKPGVTGWLSRHHQP